MHDVVIRNGTVIDGTVRRPFSPTSPSTAGASRRRYGRRARRDEIDATGSSSPPGFVDVHTHYDGQATWDPLLTPSIWHGITTVVMGNCGVGFAPAAADRHDWLIGLMEGVEGIPGTRCARPSSGTGSRSPSTSTRSTASRARSTSPRRSPHGAVRAFVMGERGAANEPATDDDIAAMAQLVAEAIAAGAVGVSVNRSSCTAPSTAARFPATFADIDEITALVHAARDGSPDAVFTTILPQAPVATAPRGTARSTGSAGPRETGLGSTFPFGGGTTARGAASSPARAENDAGARIVPQVRLHRQGLLCGLRTAHLPRPPDLRGARRPARRRTAPPAWPTPK